MAEVEELLYRVLVPEAVVRGAVYFETAEAAERCAAEIRGWIESNRRCARVALGSNARVIIEKARVIQFTRENGETDSIASVFSEERSL